MQMGMLGNLYVRPRQNRCLTNGSPCPPGHVEGDQYAYNDGDGTTGYDVEFPIQMGGFDPGFHDASFNVQPLPFAGMKDRYFLLNGRGYPDTVEPGVLSTVDPLDPGIVHPSQPVSSLIEAAPGDRILLRISNLNVTQFITLGTNGIPMEVVGLDARLLRDGAGNNLYYKTNSLTLGGGQSADVIIVAPATPGTYFLYTTNLDRLANDAENFGGMITEIQVL
jgi:FtsP/CotA-like multicopper oxidase with cupredoxin domain